MDPWRGYEVQNGIKVARKASSTHEPSRRACERRKKKGCKIGIGTFHEIENLHEHKKASDSESRECHRVCNKECPLANLPPLH